MKNYFNEPINPVNIDTPLNLEGGGVVSNGLTKLEYASIKIAAGISNYVKLDIDELGSRFIGVDMVAQMSVAIAKALLTELQNTEK